MTETQVLKSGGDTAIEALLESCFCLNSNEVAPVMSHYPGAIAQAAQRVNELDSEMMAVQQLLYRVEGHGDTRSAFDIDLKNDTQRKARKFEVLLTDKEYQTATNTLMRLTAEKANALAHLEYLRNQFSVAKLETRRAIAQQLTDFESRQLVGL